MVKVFPHVASVGAALLAVIALYRSFALEDAMDIRGLCAVGRSVEGCMIGAGGPSSLQKARDVSAYVYRSGGRVSGSSDLVFIVKDGVIIRILDLDLEGDRKEYERLFR